MNNSEIIKKISGPNVFDLSDKVALVSGASRGIGEAVAKLLAQFGAHVVITSRDIENVKLVQQKIVAEGGKATAMSCDISDAESIQSLFDQIKSQFGRLNILVNNAASNPFFGPILDMPDGALQKSMDVNVGGYFRMSQISGRLMKEQGDGVIINTASVAASTPGPFQGIYAMTKAAIVSMTQVFAKECAANGIRVNAVLPGLTETKFSSALTENEQLLKMFLPNIPAGRMAQPEEIAPAFLFLASDAGSYVTGSCLTIDGGFLA